MVKCIVCDQKLEAAEYAELVDEFKDFPAHVECFDEFDDAEAFLDYARSISKKDHSSFINQQQFKKRTPGLTNQ